MESTALIRVERPADVPAQPSPFGQMVAILEARHPGESETTHFGAVRWGGLPVRHVLADAAALVIDAVGKRLDRPAETLDQARKIADLTEARLCVGLLLLHGSPERAADAFDRDVLGAIRASAASLPATDPPSTLASLWVVPAYKFLVACVKRGREEAERLRPAVARLERRNRAIDPRHAVLTDLGTESMLVTLIEGGTGTLTGNECARILALPAFLDGYEAALETGIRVLRPEIPLRGHELLGIDVGLFQAWIHTAVLRVASESPTVSPGAMSPDEAESAHELVRTSDATKIADRIVMIVRERTAGLPERWRADGEAYVREAATAHVRRLTRCQTGPLISEHLIDPYLSSGSSVVLDHDQAMRYLDEGNGGESAELPAGLAESIERGIEWNELDAESVGDIVRGGKLSVTSVIAHLGDLAPGTRKKVVSSLLDERPDLINALLEGGHIAWRTSLGGRYADELRPTLLSRAIRERLADAKTTENDLLDTVSLMLRLPAESLAEIWNERSLHDPLTVLTGLLLFDSAGMGVTAANEARLVGNAGDAFGMIALECYADDRSALYGDTEFATEEDPLPRWEETAAVNNTSWAFVKALQRAFGPRLAALLAANAEDDCYARLVAKKPNRDALLAQFRANRETYYGTRKRPPSASP